MFFNPTHSYQSHLLNDHAQYQPLITSTPAATNAATRSSVPAPVPTAAPTRNWPNSSLQAKGFSFLLEYLLP